MAAHGLTGSGASAYFLHLPSNRQTITSTEPLGLRVPEEARTWWKWHNGARSAFIVADGGKAFASLERCVELATMMRGTAREVAEPYRLSAEASDAMAHSVQDVWPVLYRDRDGGSDASWLAPSIGALVRRWITVLDAGAETWDRRQDRWVSIPEKLPPGYDDRSL